jgi:glutathione S-transferase
MKNQYRLYAWQQSFFAGKIRAYLNYKGLDYQEKTINAFDLKVTLPNKIGVTAMPAVETSKGEWLSDTPEIIAELEKRHPTRPIMPPSPRQAIAALLFENWVDDSWLVIAIHTRWSYSENYDHMLREEGGKNLLPFAPRFIRNRVTDKVFAATIRSYMPRQGITAQQIPLIERWSIGLLDLLETHFAQQPYLFGNKPSIADYSLVGAFYGHLNRDPWPKREWLNPRPHCQSWTERTHGGDRAPGEWLGDDKIPSSLQPLFDIIFKEFFPMLEKTTLAVRDYIALNKLQPGAPLPRTMNGISFPMANSHFNRSTMTYTLWRMQRIQAYYRSLPNEQKDSVSQWFNDMGQPDLLTMDFGPILERDGLSTRLAIASSNTSLSNDNGFLNAG